MNEINKIGIVGCGRMGAGIAKICSEKFDVIIFDIEKEKLLNNKIINNSRITTTTELLDLSCCDLIIECVFEDLLVKKEIFLRLEKIIQDTSLLASNTSSLSINELAGFLKKPDRFIGLHFMNPAEKIELVEIIKCKATSDDTFLVISDFCKKINKVIVESKDVNGFILNRILITMLNEALIVLESGIASKEDIDKAMVIGAKHPIGPIALIDMIGLDIVYNILMNFNSTFGDKYYPSRLLNDYISKGFLGKKVGRGFYEYVN